MYEVQISSALSCNERITKVSNRAHWPLVSQFPSQIMRHKVENFNKQNNPHSFVYEAYNCYPTWSSPHKNGKISCQINDDNDGDANKTLLSTLRNMQPIKRSLSGRKLTLKLEDTSPEGGDVEVDQVHLCSLCSADSSPKLLP